MSVLHARYTESQSSLHFGDVCKEVPAGGIDFLAGKCKVHLPRGHLLWGIGKGKWLPSPVYILSFVYQLHSRFNNSQDTSIGHFPWFLYCSYHWCKFHREWYGVCRKEGTMGTDNSYSTCTSERSSPGFEVEFMLRIIFEDLFAS